MPPDAEWDLYLIPIFDGRPDSDVYATNKEAWIDVVAKKWVPADLIGDGTHRHLATQKLLRVPLWSTKRKAESGGGFVGSFPHSGTFGETGVLKTSELQPHGSRASPWVMQVDHGWLRTHVQLRYFVLAHGTTIERVDAKGRIRATGSIAEGPIACVPAVESSGAIWVATGRTVWRGS